MFLVLSFYYCNMLYIFPLISIFMLRFTSFFGLHSPIFLNVCFLVKHKYKFLLYVHVLLGKLKYFQQHHGMVRIYSNTRILLYCVDYNSTYLLPYYYFLGIFTKLQKVTVSFIMFVCMEQLGSHCTDFHESLYWSIF